MQEAKPGNKVGVRYKGWLAKNDKVFDQTKGSKTFNFRVGAASALAPASCEAACHMAMTAYVASWHCSDNAQPVSGKSLGRICKYKLQVGATRGLANSRTLSVSAGMTPCWRAVGAAVFPVVCPVVWGGSPNCVRIRLV